MASKGIQTPAYERIESNRNHIVKRWVDLCKRNLPNILEKSENERIDSMPAFLDKLCEALKPSEKLSQANADNTIAPLHGAQRVIFSSYNIKNVMEEYEILLKVIKEFLNESGGYTGEEYEILSTSLWRAARESAFAYSTAIEQKRSSAERHFELLVQEVVDYAIFMIDPKGIVCTWNEGARRIKQYEANEVIGQHYRMLYRPEDREAGRPEINMERSTREGRHIDQWWRMKKDGSVFWADVSMTPIYEGRRLIGFGKVVHDLTEKKLAEEKLHEAKKVAEEANTLKTTFLANMSHEIRTPLNAILGFTEVIKSHRLPPEERDRYIDIIDKNGHALVDLIDDILDISKVEAGKLVIEKMPIDIRKLVGEVTGLFEARAAEKGLEFNSRVSPNVPQKVVSDPIRVRQILNNIVGNAVKFTNQGQISLTVDHIENIERPLIRFIVKDTGKGISEEQRKYLFEPFVQADASTTRQFGGTGLGLALSRKLARHLGGDVFIGDEGQQGKGCSFNILIGHYADELESFEAKKFANMNQVEQTVASKQVRVPEPKGDLSNLKVLLVEDIEDNRILIKTFLRRAGAQVSIAFNGAEGVDKALREDFDIVVMDVQMPVLDGNDAARKLRDAGFKKPMIALTAHAMREEVRNSLQAGFDAHVSKPIDSKRLLKCIIELVTQKKDQNVELSSI